MSKTTKTIAALGMVAALGVAALPFGAFALDPTSSTADDSANTEVEVTISPAIALSLSTGEVSTTMDTSDKDETMTNTATVSTNNLGGYTLSVKSTAASAALVSTEGNHINPVSTGGVVEGTEAWGIKTDATGSLSTYTAVPGSGDTALTVKEKTQKALNDDVVITYGVSTRADQETGVYSNTITYTAAVK